MSFRLDGHVALVTGSSRGLGREIARTLGLAGAKVAVNGFHDLALAQEVARTFGEEGITAHAFRADVTDEEQVGQLVSQVTETLGAPDIVVANATCDQPQRSIEEYDWAFYSRMLDFFLKSPYLLTRACLPHMKQERWGRIINLGSEVYHRGTAPFSAYVSAKGAQLGFTRSMGSELAPFGITVNTVSPGWIPTERHESDPQELKDAYRATIPMDRWGVPADIAAAVLYFASEEASFVTAQDTIVNGGISMG